MSYMRQIKGMIAQGKTTEDICHEMGITLQVYTRWVEADRARKMRALELENQTLKQALAALAMPAPQEA